MDKNLRIEFVVVKEDRRYIFSMPYGSPQGESYDAAYEVLAEIAKLAKENVEKAQRAPEGDVDGSQ